MQPLLMVFLLVQAITVAAAPKAPAGTARCPSNSDSKKRVSMTDVCSLGYCTSNGGTNGGAGGKTTTVRSLEELTAAAASEGPLIIVVSGTITGPAKVHVASNKSVLGAAGSSLDSVGLTLVGVKNVILRNLKISKVPAKHGDAITIQASKNVWVDHCDLSSDMAHGKDHYDGLVDVTHASDFVTVSNTYLHDHYKVSLVGHSDKNAKEDVNHLRVTFANNHWNNIGSRAPSVRFGVVHIFNNHWRTVGISGVNTRMDARVLVESSVFSNCTSQAILSKHSNKVGHVAVNDVDLGSSTNTAHQDSFPGVDYDYKLIGSATVEHIISAKAGQTLDF